MMLFTIRVNLDELQLFHTDSAGEFDNQLNDDVLHTFHIKRSLSLKGCLFDNAVAEATFKIFKSEFIYGRNFESLDQLWL